MPRNNYRFWTETQLLAELLMLQKQRAVGRTTETRLANELTRNDDGKNFTPIEVQIEDVEYALWELNPTKYPLQQQGGGVTLQNFQ